MKVRVLYPTEVNQHVGKEVEAGAIIDLDADTAEVLIGNGSAEDEKAKPEDHPQWAQINGVEQATAAPGEKRPARKRPAKK